MRAEKLLITTSARGRVRSVLWDTAAPMGLGHPFKWVMERTPQGVVVRDISSGQSLSPASLIRLSNAQLEKGSTLDLPGLDQSAPRDLKVSFRHLRQLKPAYISTESKDSSADADKLPALFAFAGVRKTMIGCQAIHSAYVAYARGRPVFTVFNTPEGYRIKPLLGGLQLKLKGQKPIPGPVGEVWNLTNEQVVHATVTRGWYWWRFNEVKLSAAGIGSAALEPEVDAVYFARVLRRTGFALAAFLLLTLLWPNPPAKKEESTPPQVVQFAFQKPRNPLRAQPRPKQKAEPKVEAKATEVAQADPAKTEQPSVAKESAAKRGEKKDPAKNAGATRRAEVMAKRAEAAAQAVAKAASNQARSLREALGGAMSLTQKAVVKGHDGAKVPLDSSLGIFGGKGSELLKPTEIKPGLLISNATVGTMGGGDVGGNPNSKLAQGIGYSKGEHAQVKGQGNSYVSVDTNGTTVDEGLSKDEVGAVIHAHMSEVRYCYEGAMLYQAKIEGKIVMAFVIGLNGVVKTAKVQSSTIKEQQLEECVMGRLKTWKFPKPKGTADVAVSYPFLFKTLARE